MAATSESKQGNHGCSDSRACQHGSTLIDFNFDWFFSKVAKGRDTAVGGAACRVQSEQSAGWLDNHLGRDVRSWSEREIKRIFSIKSALNDALDLLACKVAWRAGVGRAVRTRLGIVSKGGSPVKVGTVAVYRECAVRGGVLLDSIQDAAFLRRLGRAFIVLVFWSLYPELCVLRVLCHLADSDVLCDRLFVNPGVR